MTSDAVRAAASHEDLNHRDPRYLELVRETKQRLLEFYPETAAGWTPYLIGGSGTVAVEAMITSCINTGPVLVIENGYYCQRVREIVEIHRMPLGVVSIPWVEKIQLDQVRQALASGLNGVPYEAVIMVHDETTVGRLNDVASVGALANEFGARLLVDAMSSYAADYLDFTHVHAVVASANKCFHGLPGVGFVLVRDALAAEMPSFPRRSFYMSLPQYAGENIPLTPPVPALFAFRQALREAEGGITRRHARYAEIASRVRAEMAQRGLAMALPVDEASITLTSFALPAGWSYDRWFQANFEKGFVLYACKGPLRERYFQVGHMGEIRDEHLEQWFRAVDELLA